MQDAHKRDEKGRILPGHTLNPDGRPKGSASVVAAIRRKLKENVDDDAPLEEKRTYLEAITEKYFEKALEEGDTKILRDLIDRVDGKPVQTNKIKGELKTDELEKRTSALKKVYKDMIDEGN